MRFFISEGLFFVIQGRAYRVDRAYNGTKRLYRIVAVGPQAAAPYGALSPPACGVRLWSSSSCTREKRAKARCCWAVGGFWVHGSHADLFTVRNRLGGNHLKSCYWLTDSEKGHSLQSSVVPRSSKNIQPRMA